MEILPDFDTQGGSHTTAKLHHEINGAPGAKADASLYITRDETVGSNDVHINLACVFSLPDGGDSVAMAIFDILYRNADLHTNPGHYGFPTPDVNDLSVPGTVSVGLKNKPAFMEAYDYEGRLYKDADAQTTAFAEGSVDESTAFFKQNFVTKTAEGVYYAKDVTYLVSSPVTFQVSLDEYYSIVSG